MATRLISTPYRVFESEFTITDDSRNANPSINRSMSSISPTGVPNKQSGSTLPGWRDRVLKGVDASTAYRRTYTECERVADVSCSVSTLSKFLPSYRINSNGRYTFIGSTPVQFNSDTETQQRALAKIKKQLASRTGVAQLMAPVAEIRELRALVAQAVQLSGNFLQAVVHAKKTKGRSAWKFLTDTWLGYNFALRPLVADIGAAGNAIATYISRSDDSYRLSATATKRGRYTYVPSTIISAAPFGCNFVLVGEANYTLSYRYVGAFDLALRSNENYSLLDHLGFGLDQIPATLWELTAFSWMFDYFANIGAYLEDVFSSPSGVTKYLVLNRRFELSCQNSMTIRVVPGNPNGMTMLTNKADFSQVKYFEFERTPLSQLPHASLYFKSFDSIGSHGITKLLNLISVARL